MPLYILDLATALFWMENFLLLTIITEKLIPKKVWPLKIEHQTKIQMDHEYRNKTKMGHMFYHSLPYLLILKEKENNDSTWV